MLNNMSIVEQGRNIQKINNSVNYQNQSLSTQDDFSNESFSKGYNANTGKMAVFSTNGFRGQVNILTSSLPYSRKGVLSNGTTGLF